MLMTYEEVLEITKVNESFKMKHQQIGNTTVAMCTYFLASPGDFFDAKLDGSMINATELRGITFVNENKGEGWKTFLFLNKFFNIGQTNGTNITNMELIINGEREICNINKLYSTDGVKTFRAIDLKIGMEVGVFDRNTETVGKLFKIETLEKTILETARPENSWMYQDVKDLEIERVANKDDGSAIRFLILNGELVAKTKFSLEAEQCAMAMEIVNNDSNLKEFIIKTLESGYAAIFEIVSPFNKIVLSYPDTRLKLLQLRDENNDGKYLDIYNNDLVKLYNIEVADKEPKYTLDKLLELKETVEDKEGWVVTFKNGKMAKIKTNWYMNLHGILSDGLKEHKIIEKVIDETIDDTIAMIPEENIEERDFIDGITNVIIKHINHIASDAEMKFKSFYKTLENDNDKVITNSRDIITLTVDNKSLKITPSIKKAFAKEFKNDKELFPYIMNFIKGSTFEEVEKIVAERVKFDCRKLGLAKSYLRKLGFTTELKLIEDDE